MPYVEPSTCWTHFCVPTISPKVKLFGAVGNSHQGKVNSLRRGSLYESTAGLFILGSCYPKTNTQRKRRVPSELINPWRGIGSRQDERWTGFGGLGQCLLHS